ILRMAWRLLFREGGGFAVVVSFALMHLAGLLDRHGWRRLADRLRGYLDLDRVAVYCGRLLDTSFRFIVTEAGGCAVDIDNERDYGVARLAFERWRADQRERAAAVRAH
ncbi:MAG TPA: hypothetical protein VEC18_10010, partial [Myxococcota bacterium]|nr:hypothetical protein [Myxococcota bacterium]